MSDTFCQKQPKSVGHLATLGWLMADNLLEGTLMPPIQKPPQVPEKSTLFAVGLKEGDSIDWVEGLGIPNRVNNEGYLEIKIRDAYLTLLEVAEPFRDHFEKKRDRFLLKIFQSINQLRQATVDGIPVRNRYDWDIPSVAVPYSAKDLPQEFVLAPFGLQQLAFDRAREEYLRENESPDAA